MKQCCNKITFDIATRERQLKNVLVELRNAIWMDTYNKDVLRRGERRMHFDGNSFIVRNAGHSAGFDDKNQLKVYWYWYRRTFVFINTILPKYSMQSFITNVVQNSAGDFDYISLVIVFLSVSLKLMYELN